jgi:hypothetical protein
MSQRKIDDYKHLDADPAYGIKMEMTIPQLVKYVVAQNYGTHRFLSALVHELRAEENPDDPSQLAPVIEKALNEGFFY